MTFSWAISISDISLVDSLPLCVFKCEALAYRVPFQINKSIVGILGVD